MANEMVHTTYLKQAVRASVSCCWACVHHVSTTYMVTVDHSSAWKSISTAIANQQESVFFAETTLSVLCVYDPTGACHCQIMDWAIPGSVDMTKVKFDAQGEDDCRHNFGLLLEAFSKNGITTVCTVSIVDVQIKWWY